MAFTDVKQNIPNRRRLGHYGSQKPPHVMARTLKLGGHSKNSINTLCYLECLKKHHIVPIKNGKWKFRYPSDKLMIFFFWILKSKCFPRLLEWKGHYKSKLIQVRIHFYPMMKQLFSEGVTMQMGTPNGLMSLKMVAITCSALHNHRMSTQLSICGCFCILVFENPLKERITVLPLFQ